jgi:hypothetical protein
MQRSNPGHQGESFDDLQNQLAAEVDGNEEVIEVTRKPLPTRICLASARFAVNSILCGSFGGYGLNALLLYGNNDPVEYSDTMWNITNTLYLSPFVFVARGVEYTAEISTIFSLEQPATLAELKFVVADNMPSAIEHMVIDTGLLVLAVWLYLKNVEDPDLLELCLLNCLITLARNFVEVPLNYIGNKILSEDAMEGFRNSCLFAPARRPARVTNNRAQIQEEGAEDVAPRESSFARSSRFHARDYK